MVAYHYDFRIALMKGSPNTVAANATVLVYDPADTGYTTPLTAYSDPALSTIINLVADQRVSTTWKSPPKPLASPSIRSCMSTAPAATRTPR